MYKEKLQTKRHTGVINILSQCIIADCFSLGGQEIWVRKFYSGNISLSSSMCSTGFNDTLQEKNAPEG